MPVRHARSETRGRPPFGRRGGVGKNGSTTSHNGSGSSAAAIPVHATSPTRIRFRRFCYTLLPDETAARRDLANTFQDLFERAERAHNAAVEIVTRGNVTIRKATGFNEGILMVLFSCTRRLARRFERCTSFVRRASARTPPCWRDNCSKPRSPSPGSYRETID
jgi:hypothetical protein